MEGSLPFQVARDPVGDRTFFSTSGPLCSSETIIVGTSVDSAGSTVVEESFGMDDDDDRVGDSGDEEVGLYGMR